MPSPLRIGYVPEHFSTPLHFAVQHYSLDATLIPFPAGTGHMVTSLQSNSLDIALGLTEGFVRALGNQGGDPEFQLVGTYVESPLYWAISTGTGRDFDDVDDLYGKRIGVSRIGSGSYVMSYVFADLQGWLKVPGEHAFKVVPLETFERLRIAVNVGRADFFMWEHFTSKRYFDNGEIKKIGEICTPWSSWKIAARNASDERLPDFFTKLNQGVSHFLNHPEEAVAYISSQLDYSEEDAREWMKTVDFAEDVKGVKEETVENTIAVLIKAGCMPVNTSATKMIGIVRAP